MGKGGFRFREKKVEEEGLEIDYSDDEHQVFDEMAVRVQLFLLPLENPNTDARIKKAERKIEKLNRARILIARKLKERMEARTELSYFTRDSEITLLHRERLNILHLSLDKLTFSNNAYKGKPVSSCSSGGEVDKQKLSFLMAHGCKDMADERKLLREVNASQEKDGGMIVDELHAPIQLLKQQIHSNYWRHKKTDDDIARKQAILKDIKQHEIARERAIADAVVKGRFWNSLGSKNAIQAEALNTSSDEQRVKAKAKMGKVEKNISSLEKRLKDTTRKKGEAYNTILRLKKQQYGEKVEKFMQ